MTDINRVLYTAKQAILSNLTAINVTGSNIANVNTEGYSRLRPIFESVGTKDAMSKDEQIGVRIAEIQRMYDKFLDSQIVAHESAVGSATIRRNLLSQIEGIMNESAGGGINDALSRFWNAWDDLSVNPSGKPQRDILIAKGQELSDIINQRAEKLTELQYAADQMIADTVTKLNGYFQDMADLNVQIVTMESAGIQATSLKDKRTELLRKISAMIDINYVERANGSVLLYLSSNGKAFVEESNYWQLAAKRNPANANLFDIVLTNEPNNPLNNNIRGGELGGLLDIRDVTLASYINELDQMTSSIINKVNAQHRAGYDQDGNSGLDFFAPTVYAKYLQVNKAIAADTRKIAASSTVNADGDNATAIAALREDKMFSSISQVSVTVGVGSATGTINNIGQAFQDTASPIALRRGATSTASDWTILDNGGYASLRVISANDSSVVLSLNGHQTADITLKLSGMWANGDTLSFSLAKQDNTTGINGFFNAFMAKIGQDASSSAYVLDREKTIANQQINQREQLSGVSLDEEMLNLIKFQMAYNASGRITKAISDMMDILINLGR